MPAKRPQPKIDVIGRVKDGVLIAFTMVFFFYLTFSAMGGQERQLAGLDCSASHNRTQGIGSTLTHFGGCTSRY